MFCAQLLKVNLTLEFLKIISKIKKVEKQYIIYPFFKKTERIIQKPLLKFEWRQIAILRSTDAKYKETFNLIKEFVEKNNGTELYPLVSVESYDKSVSIKILKEQSRSEWISFIKKFFSIEK